MKTEEPQWQGFQQFCDQSDNTNPDNTNQNNKQEPGKLVPYQTIPKNFKQTKIESQNKMGKPKTSPNKKNKVKAKLPQINEKVSSIQPVQKQKSQQKIRQTNKSPVKNSVRQNKYQRIPIVRKEDEMRYTGNIFYRGFMPRSSDNYFRLLKDINFQTSTKKPTLKSGQNITFDSRFESGNLNLAFQVRNLQIEGDGQLI